MRSILMEVAELAAYSSVVVGELPRMTRPEAEGLLGEAGMLGMLQPEPQSGVSSPDGNRSCSRPTRSLSWFPLDIY